MDPTTTCCPNMACPARGQTGQRNIGIHSRKDRRFICTQCRKTFAATVRDSLLSPAHCGRPWCADRHVARPWLSGASSCGGLWVRRADGRGMEGTRWPPGPGRPGASGRATAGPRPGAGRRDTRQEPRGHGLDGARSDGFYPVVAGGEVSEQRDMPLIRRLIERVRACALQRPLLLCTDGWCSSIRAMREFWTSFIWCEEPV